MFLPQNQLNKAVNLQNLQELVEADSDIDTLNNHSFSPLYLALLNKHHDCAQYLIKEGA